MNNKPRLIAFYLPQYHPIRENDLFWGKGFTEWTNVTRAKPLFNGHIQPFLPADLGFYDLRVPETRQQQADLAREAGIEGFCYWHYWFGNGVRALERIFDEVVSSGHPDFPFCLGWANESWTGKWHGLDDSIIFQQLYPGEQDYIEHFKALLPAFLDKRYITADGKPVFIIYRPDLLPSAAAFTSLWTKLGQQNGLPGFFFISNRGHQYDISSSGIDRYVLNAPTAFIHQWQSQSQKSLKTRLKRKILEGLHYSSSNPLHTAPYEAYVENCIQNPLLDKQLPLIVPNWDNTPRCGNNGCLLSNSTPHLFKKLLEDSLRKTDSLPFQERFLFIKSWNEWAEGNVLEPSVEYGRIYLQSLREVMLALHDIS